MALEGLKIQAEMTEEDPRFDISPLTGNPGNPLARAISLEDWAKKGGMAAMDEGDGEKEIALLVVVQTRDPLRRYEAVGAPVIALVQATAVGDGAGEEEEEKFKVGSLHVGGLKVRPGVKRHAWDAEKQRLTAMQWLVAYGLGKAPKKGKPAQAKGHDCLWSISSRVMADMWLKPTRNPDVKFPKQM